LEQDFHQDLKFFFESTNKTAFNQLVEARKDAQAQVFGLEKELKEGDEETLNESQEKRKIVSSDIRQYFREIITAPSKRARR